MERIENRRLWKKYIRVMGVRIRSRLACPRAPHRLRYPVQEKLDIMESNFGDANEKVSVVPASSRQRSTLTHSSSQELWHGTGNTAPARLYNAKQGVAFDMRHASAGLWGRGAYFAEDSR